MRTDLLIFIIAACEMKQLPNQTKNHSNNSVDPHG